MTVGYPYKLRSKKPHMMSLALLSAFAAMGAILMTPALPKIAKDFNISVGLAQQTITSFLLGYALGQLMYGPIANRFGRKPALYIGIAIATIGSLLSILSSPIESFRLLILGRFLEALGASAGLVVSFTIISDFYYPQQIRFIMGLLMLAFSLVPGIGVALGGVLVEYIDWQACFYFLLLYGLMLIFPVTRLSETLVEIDRTALHYRHIFRNYGRILQNKKLIGFAACSGFSSACIYVFGAEGPFLGIQVLHIKPAAYGLLGLMPYVGTLIGSAILLQLTQLRSLSVLKIGFLAEVIAALVMFFCFKLSWVTISTLLVPMGFFCIGHPMLSGTALPLAMRQTGDQANGAAMTNFIAMSVPVLITFLLGVLHIAESRSWIMPFIFLLALSLMASTYYFLCAEKKMGTP